MPWMSIARMRRAERRWAVVIGGLALTLSSPGSVRADSPPRSIQWANPLPTQAPAPVISEEEVEESLQRRLDSLQAHKEQMEQVDAAGSVSQSGGGAGGAAPPDAGEEDLPRNPSFPGYEPEPEP